MLDCIKQRRSIRAFLKKEVAEEKLKEVLLSAMYAPTSWGTKAWEFVIVRDRARKEALSKATAHARFVKDAPLVIAICYDPSVGRRFKEDSSICAEHIHLEAVNQGLASCFVQVADAGDPPGSAEPYVKKLLNIPDGLRVQCMMPLGYAKRELKGHKESEFEPAKIHYETF
ncbi:MAG: nitroreductase family protein [Deltaproteobacteria bacterium]|nr:nitroreductase family protein [Deltaproteobacteria bacterium]